MNLAKWMDDLDGTCQSDIDMTIHDLPETSFREAYMRGITPEQFRFQHVSGSDGLDTQNPPMNHVVSEILDDNPSFRDIVE
ncbi:MAG: hypothetical protein P4L46_20580 [Fimbriimonas sp.]|nr:hypothetical protein [Fimbriimonas sp.]